MPEPRIRDENHWAWWEYPLSAVVMPFCLVAWALMIVLFVCIIPLGIVGAGVSWIVKLK